jgi:hypothetical protein
LRRRKQPYSRRKKMTKELGSTKRDLNFKGSKNKDELSKRQSKGSSKPLSSFL